MKNKNIIVSIIGIIIIDVFIGQYIFTRGLDYSVVVTCWITLLAGSVGGVGTLIAVGLSNSVSRKQLELSIIYKSIDEIKGLIGEVLKINNLIVGLKNLDVADIQKVELYCNELIDNLDSIRADVIAIRNMELRENVSTYFNSLNLKVCDLKYSKTNEEAMNSSYIIQSEMLKVQDVQMNLERELKELYLKVDNL